MYKRGFATILLVAHGFRYCTDTRTRSPRSPARPKRRRPHRESRYKTEVITDKLTGPWALAFLPDGNFLVSERRGTLRTVSPDRRRLGADRRRAARESRRRAELPRSRARSEFRDEPLRVLHVFRAAEGRSRARVADRALLQRGLEQDARRAPRARSRRRARQLARKLSADNRRLEDFEVLIEGRVERRIVVRAATARCT